MQQEDLKQIKQLLDGNNDTLRKEIKENNDVLRKEIKDNNEVLLDKMDEKINDLAVVIHGEFENVHKDISHLRDGQKEIKLKLDNVAYRFEIVELQKMADLPEKKIGIKMS